MILINSSAFEKLAFDKAEFSRKAIRMVGRGILGGAKFVAKHPIASTATVAGGLMALSAARKVEPAYNLINEPRKRGIMLDQRQLMVQQRDLLDQIAAASNRYADRSDVNPTQPFAVEPLA